MSISGEQKSLFPFGRSPAFSVAFHPSPVALSLSLDPGSLAAKAARNFQIRAACGKNSRIIVCMIALLSASSLSPSQSPLQRDDNDNANFEIRARNIFTRRDIADATREQLRIVARRRRRKAKEIRRAIVLNHLTKMILQCNNIRFFIISRETDILYALGACT